MLWMAKITDLENGCLSIDTCGCVLFYCYLSDVFYHKRTQSIDLNESLSLPTKEKVSLQTQHSVALEECSETVSHRKTFTVDSCPPQNEKERVRERKLNHCFRTKEWVSYQSYHHMLDYLLTVCVCIYMPTHACNRM